MSNTSEGIKLSQAMGSMLSECGTGLNEYRNATVKTFCDQIAFLRGIESIQESDIEAFKKLFPPYIVDECIIEVEGYAREERGLDGTLGVTFTVATLGLSGILKGQSGVAAKLRATFRTAEVLKDSNVEISTELIKQL